MEMAEFIWKPGDVLEKRYLVESIYYTSDSKDIVVWRIYDNLLEISCFALVKLSGEIKELSLIARSLQRMNGLNEEDIIIQVIKKIEKRNVLIFSLSKKYQKADFFKEFLQLEPDKGEDIIWNLENIQNREQVLPAGTCLDGRYKVMDCLGIGGFGITYLCEDIFLQRLVALKEYFPADWAERDGKYVTVKQSKLLQAYRYGLQSFLKEIRITAKFIHTSHMVTIYDALEENDTAYMVIRYIPGISLGREMRKRKYKPFAPLEVADIIFPVMDALEEIHAKKIIHSDISPGNIMQTEQGDIYLIDMGAAKYNLEAQPPLSAAFLKMDYAAPEQYRTAKEGIPKGEGPWTDIYALGATIYYLLTGDKPTDGMSRLYGKDTDLTSVLIGKIPIAWVALLQKSMELDSTKRIQSVAVFKEEIEKIL